MNRVPRVFATLLVAGVLSAAIPLQAEKINRDKESVVKTEFAAMHLDVQRILSKNAQWQASSLDFSTAILTSHIHYGYKSILYKQNRERSRESQNTDSVPSANAEE